MASYRKLQSGKWQAQVAICGRRKSKSFYTKAEARNWAAVAEYSILHGPRQEAAQMTVASLFNRYAQEVSPKKRGARWEVIRLKKLIRDELARVKLADLSVRDLVKWRDKRLLEVSPASVRREINLISSVFSRAIREWQLLFSNPVSEMTKPQASPPRFRRVTDQEVAALVEVAGSVTSPTGKTVHAFRFAIETAMRLGEIARLRWEDIDTSHRVAVLHETKNGSSRAVPLSNSAVRMLEMLPRDDGPCFGTDAGVMSTLFRRVRRKADIHDLTFHDSRHEAITRLSKKVDVLPLARIVGHKDIKMLMIYYNESAEDLAKLL